MNIKKFLIGTVASVVMFGAMTIPAFAAPNTLNFGQQLNAGTCDKTGNPVINVTQKVVNDVDSGQAGNYWAFDNENRKIQVWQQTDESYCVLVNYQGKFNADAGQTSPGATGALSGAEKGTFEGGYNATIIGTLIDNPSWTTKGSVGTTDYQCDIDGNCPGYVSWIGQYFNPSYSFSYNWWGWIYHGGNNGTWVNASTGNSGDITGN